MPTNATTTLTHVTKTKNMQATHSNLKSAPSFRIWLSLITLVLLIPFTSVHAATLTSVVNRNQVGLNETLTLLVTFDNQVNEDALDLSPLYQNFEILGISPNTSSSVSIINGQATREASTSWRVTLLPRNKGNLTIPSLIVEGARSQAITISVSAVPQGDANSTPLSATINVSSNAVLPEEQILVTILLSAANNVGDLNAPPLQIDGAEVVQLGQDVQRKINNGISRQEITLRYAVFAQTPGTLNIPALIFSGSEGGRTSIFTNRGRQVVARTTPKSITVTPIPQTSLKPWLVANDISISADWAGDVQNIRVGEPITRSVSIVARGQKAEAIPPLLSSSQSSAYQSYQDQAQLKTDTLNSGIQGTRIESEAIIANTEGELVLEEQRLQYWNARTNKIETAVLPAQTLEVLPAIVSNSSTTPNTVNTNTNNLEQHSAPPSLFEQQTGIRVSPVSPKLWQWLSAILAMLCLAQALYIFKTRGTRNTQTDSAESSIPESATEKEAWANFIAQLKSKTLKNEHVDSKDVAALRKLLQVWTNVFFEQAVSIDSISELLSHEAAIQLRSIDSQAFSNATNDALNLDLVTKELSLLRKRYRNSSRSKSLMKSRQKAESLPALYPRG